MINSDLLNFVFGPGLGDTPKERARVSNKIYVRSLDQLAEYSPTAKGRRMTCTEALDAFGFEALCEVASEGSTLIAASRTAAGDLLKNRRELLGLDIKYVSRTAHVTPEVINNAELYKLVPIREIEKVARALGLDERLISFKSEADPDNLTIAYRLRTIGSEHPQLNSSAVSAFSEAAWVASTQIRLQKALGLSSFLSSIEPSFNYGAPGYPTYQHGYYLAHKARETLGLGEDVLQQPIRTIAENILGIPIIQTELGDGIAGATIETNQQRAIIVNLSGNNRHVFVRRATIAHELGHLLFDPPAKLNNLVVDDYQQIEGNPFELTDPVEQRANAFGVTFLAPQAAVVKFYENSTINNEDAVWEVMNHFGIGFTAARYQIWNGFEKKIPFESLTIKPGKQIDPAWEGSEAFSAFYHPLQNIRLSRGGRFCAVVLRAAQEKLISWDSAAEYLETTENKLHEAESNIKDLFPTVFY